MRRVVTAVIVASSVALVLASVPASASWTSNAAANAWGPSFDQMEVFIVSGGTDFETPGLTNFSSTSWSANLVNPDYSLATGGAVVIDSWLYWNETYTAAMSEPFVEDRLYWGNGVFLSGARMNWDGANWTYISVISSPSGYDRSPSPIPEPEIYAMMMVGLGVLSFVARRRKKAG